MFKKVALRYNAVNPADKTQISNKLLGEIEMYAVGLTNKRLIRAYAYLYFPEELGGKDNVEILASLAN